jgi:hypothetical protein
MQFLVKAAKWLAAAFAVVTAIAARVVEVFSWLLTRAEPNYR